MLLIHDALDLSAPLHPSFGCFLLVSFLFYIVVPKLACSARGETAQHTVPSLAQLAVLGVMHPRVQLAPLAARAHCCLVLNFSSTRPLDPFLQEHQLTFLHQINE